MPVFPGPDRLIRLADFEAGRAMSRRYRNRRIGEFLKELDLSEGRSTGVSKILKAMTANGSTSPIFETDDDRVSSVVRLPAHQLAQGSESAPQATMDVTPEVASLLAGIQRDIAHNLQVGFAAVTLKLDDAIRHRIWFWTPAKQPLFALTSKRSRPTNPLMRSARTHFKRLRASVLLAAPQNSFKSYPRAHP